jgi:hypothetical protein
VHDRELAKYSQHLAFPDEVSLCPHEDKTNRKQARDLLKSMDKLNRSARENIFRAMGNIYGDYIVPKLEKRKPPKR